MIRRRCKERKPQRWMKRLPLRNCVMRQATRARERERGKCGHTASCQEGAKSPADVSEPWCITLSQRAPAPLVLWRVQNPRRQGGFPAGQDALLCTKANKSVYLGRPCHTVFIGSPGQFPLALLQRGKFIHVITPLRRLMELLQGLISLMCQLFSSCSNSPWDQCWDPVLTGVFRKDTMTPLPGS